MVDVSNGRGGATAPVPKGYYRGTHRMISPAATCARVRPLMPVMGITRIANVTGLDTIGIPVVMVCRPNSRALAVAQGKGLDLEAAKASGLMESVEAYHAEHITLPLKLASQEELRYTHRLADVERLPRFVDSRFHAHLPILWIEGFDLLQRAPTWVPYELVHTNYTTAMHGTFSGFVTSSNGLASGNHLLEATSHALCELVERDAYTLWTEAKADVRARTRVDLATVTDAACRTLLTKYEQAAIAVAVWEITSDIAIPAFFCRIVEQGDDPGRRLYSSSGYGCHPTRAIALARALTEAAQSRLTFISGSRDDCVRSTYVELGRPEVVRQRQAEAAAPDAPRAFATGANWQAETFDEDLRWELERLRGAGITQAVLVDLTKPEFRLPVVRLVIPGLETVVAETGYLAVGRVQAARVRDEGL